jgi:hypothetical protein
VTRLDRLRDWWSTARSTWVLVTWESRAWVLFGVAGIGVKPLRESIPVLFFCSAYANAKAAAAQAQGAKLEMKQVEAEPEAVESPHDVKPPGKVQGW